MNKGFTIIELAIISVVIGLLVGGLVIYQSIVASSKYQAVMVSISKYKSDALQFRDKYNFWPGDYPLASTQWDVEAGSSATYHNGNGDGDLADDISSTPATNEAVVFWQHLNKAGFVDIAYTGLHADQYVEGTGIPIIIDDISVRIETNYYFTMGILDPVLRIAVDYIGDSYGALTAEGAYTIDTKIDDGHANSGSFIADSAEFGSGEDIECVIGGFESEGDYDLSTDGAGCVLSISVMGGEFVSW